MFIEKYSIVIPEIFLYTSLTNKTRGQKYMKKKFVAIMMVAAMAASMAACGSDGGSSGTQKGEAAHRHLMLQTRTSHLCGSTVSHQTAQQEA